MDHIKNPTTFQQQLKLLKSRGCVITDEDFCLKTLRSVNYYRFSAYILPFKNDGDTFKNGTTFEKIVNIYNFDKELRLLLFSVIEDIEIYLRTQFAYFHAHKYGSTAYLDESCFSNRHDSQKFNELIQKEIHNNKNVLFVKHHIEKYGGLFPVWVITELFTFGMLSYFYADLTTQDQKILSRTLYNTIPQNIISYLRCTTDLRNICAHYGRLYFRIFPAVPANVHVEENAKRRLWGAIQAVKALYPDATKWNEKIIPALQNLFEKYKANIELCHVAFPADWSELLIKHPEKEKNQ